MHNLLYRLIALEWSGLLIAAVVGLIGLWLRNVPFIVAALLLGIGNLAHLVLLARARTRFPPRGRLIDIGGYRVHLLAEGEARDKHPVVWFGGGHGAGASMDHLHRILASETRSILIDRPGTGWSDTGPFPRTTAREADEIARALNAAGEVGPFVFAGHSFGGLLVANIARRYPKMVACLVLLDATPLETIVFGPRLGAIRQMRNASLATALLRWCGIHINIGRWLQRRNPQFSEAAKVFEDQLGDALAHARGRDASAGGPLAEHSIYRELVGPYVAACGWETVVYDGDLGAMPVWLVAPGTAAEVLENSDVSAAGETESKRMVNFFARSRERYMGVSSNSRRVVAPAGTTHQFVYERPDFVVTTIRDAIAL